MFQIQYLFLFLALASEFQATRVKLRTIYQRTPIREKDGTMSLLMYFGIPAKWDEARLRCQVEGAILASPYTNRLKTKIVSFVKEAGFKNETIFTGVHAKFSKGDYFSIDGVPLLRLPITWAANEPNNLNDAERCLSMTEGFMADTRCERKLTYVCYKKHVDDEFAADNTSSAQIEIVQQNTANTEKNYRFDYVFREDARGWLKYHAVPATHREAENRCNAEGAHLAFSHSIPNQALSPFLQTQEVAGGVIFTAGYVVGVPERFCLTFTVNGTMSFENCTSLKPYVCYKPDTEIELTECGTTDPGYFYEPRTGSCYRFYNRGTVWSNAFMTCAAQGGHLAVIDDELEAEVVNEILNNKAIKNFYAYGIFYLTALGFYDWGHVGGSFMTIHGEPLDTKYHNWRKGEPNNRPFPTTGDLGEYCGAAHRDLELNDYPCHVPTAFLCEKLPDSLF